MNKRIREKKTKQSIIRSIDQDGIYLYTDDDQLNGIIRTRGHEAKRKPLRKFIVVILALFVLTPSICFGSSIYDPKETVVSNDDLLIRYTITKIEIANDGYIATICIRNKDEKKGLLFLERSDYERRRIVLTQVNGSAGYPAECSFDTPPSTR